jgi:hypothetical protein
MYKYLDRIERMCCEAKHQQNKEGMEAIETIQRVDNLFVIMPFGSALDLLV